MTRYAQLWAGPEDGEAVWLGDADLPPRVGVHRTADGALVPIRSRALMLDLPLIADHVQVYERATVQVVRACRDATGVVHASWLEDGSTYVWRQVVDRWLAASS